MKLNRCLGLCVMLLGLASFAAAEGLKDYPFFPFCFDMPDAKNRTLEQQAAMLKELGYEGAGHIWLNKVDERIKTLDAAGLKLYQITMAVNMAEGKPPYDAKQFKDTLALVKGRGVQFLLSLGGAKPSDESLDARAVALLREMSDLAKDSGSQLLLYPHVKNWIERPEDAIRVANKVDRPNVGVIFNLCHWLRADTSRDYRKVLQAAGPKLWSVSINGADVRDENPAGWKKYIQPLGQGDFEMAAFFKTLKEIGFKGPIGLQCFGIGGDAREHLAKSIEAWKKLAENLK